MTGGSVTVTSGGFLYSGTAPAAISTGLNFGDAEGIIHTRGILSLNGPITGTNGLTISPAEGVNVILTGASTYSGPTTLLGGNILFAGTIASDGVTAGPFGRSTDPIILSPGTFGVRLGVAGNLASATINRTLRVAGPADATANSTLATARLYGGIGTLTVNGNIELGRNLVLESNGGIGAILLNGQISGIGSIRTADARVSLSGNNTYSGGTEISIYSVNFSSNTAFGTGPIFVSALNADSPVGFNPTGGSPLTLSNALILTSTLSIVNNLANSQPLTLAGPIVVNGDRVLSGARVIVTGDISGGSITLTGNYAVTRPTGSSYVGDTIVSGFLDASNQTGSATGAGALRISSGAALTGNFQIAGDTLISGGIVPTKNYQATGGLIEPGTAHFLASLTMGASSAASLQLASPTSYSRVIADGLYTLDGAITVTVNSTYLLEVGDTFDLLDFGSLNASAFDVAADLRLSTTNLPASAAWDTSRFLTDGTVSVIAVPEPGHAALVAAAGIMGLRRRR